MSTIYNIAFIEHLCKECAECSNDVINYLDHKSKNNEFDEIYESILVALSNVENTNTNVIVNVLFYTEKIYQSDSDDERSEVSSIASNGSLTRNGEEEPLLNTEDGKGKQPSDPDKNNTAPQSTKSSKGPTVATWVFTVAGILAGAAAPAAYFAFSVSLLTTGIIAGVGVCCLVAASIIYCCNRPSNSLEGSNVEPVANGELTVS